MSSPCCLKKLIPNIGFATSASKNRLTNLKRPILSGIVSKPQAEMLAPLRDLSFGPEGQFDDVCGKMLKEAPKSARKFFPERLSGRKIRFKLAATLQAVADAGKTTIVGQQRQGARRRLPSLGRCRADGS